MIAGVLNTLVGLWLILAPAVLGYGGRAADHDRIVGPFVATFAVISIAESCRPARWANLPIGAWLVLAPWILGFPGEAAANSVAAGLAAAGLSLWKGRIRHRFGGGWSSLWRPNPAGRAAPADPNR